MTETESEREYLEQIHDRYFEDAVGLKIQQFG